MIHTQKAIVKLLHQLGTISLLALASVLLGQLAFANSASAAEGDFNHYIDNAGGQQEIRVVQSRIQSKVPAIIFVHGGGWFSDDGNWDTKFQQYAAKQGYTSFRIKYRLMPAGVIEQREDVMRAIQHVKKNAGMYNIDPAKVIVWGDSAGASLAVRAAATGKSGTAAAVGWSTPTNAFRDLFNSPQGFADGLFHSRCLGEYLPPFTMDLINFFGNNRGVIDSISKLQIPSQADSAKMLTDAVDLAGIVYTQLPSAAGRLQKAANDFGVTANISVSQDGSSGSSTALTAAQVKEKVSKLSQEELVKLGTSLYFFDKSTSETVGQAGDNSDTVSIMKQANQDIISAVNEVARDKSASDGSSSASISLGGGDGGLSSNIPLVSGGASTGSTSISGSLGINPQQISASKIAQCIDDFIQMSPALFASPRTPPSFLVSAANEYLINPQDTYQMRDKLRSMGIRSDALVLSPATDKNGGKSSEGGHMGFDKRAVAPSFKFLKSTVRAKTEAEYTKSGGKLVDRPAVSAPSGTDKGSSNSNGSGGSGSTGSGVDIGVGNGSNSNSSSGNGNNSGNNGSSDGKIYIGSGTKIVQSGSTIPGSGCNAAAVGKDKFGNRLILTAGHCGGVGMEYTTADGKKIGKTVTSLTFSGAGTNILDYAFVKVNDNVVFADDPASPVVAKEVVAPDLKMTPVCKYGHGYATTGERCGKITKIYGNDFRIEGLAMSGFDSGSPVYVYKTKVIGIVSRYADAGATGTIVDYVLSIGSPVMITRVDAAIKDVTAKNQPGAGFKIES